MEIERCGVHNNLFSQERLKVDKDKDDFMSEKKRKEKGDIFSIHQMLLV